MTDSAVDIFAPATLNGLSLRNRVIKAATFEGMTPGGRVTQALIDHHVGLARGGVGMTTVAYCAVSRRGRTFDDQLCLDAEAVEPLSGLTRAVKAAGAAVSVQLGHCGGFSKSRALGGPPLGPSSAWNPYGLLSGVPRTRAMNEVEIAATVEEFRCAARRAVDAGFDAIELHLGHGYLLSQWISPVTNRRRDRHGGCLENRLVFPTSVVRAVRDEVGPAFPLIAKLNTEDGFDGGLSRADAVAVARAVAVAGVDAIEPSGGFVSRNAFFLLRGDRPLGGMIAAERSWAQKVALALFGPVVIRRYRYQPLYFWEGADAIRAAVDVPVILLGGVTRRDHVDRAAAAGFGFVAMGRALIADPAHVHRLSSGPDTESRCTHCNRCVIEMERGGIRCVVPSGGLLSP